MLRAKRTKRPTCEIVGELLTEVATATSGGDPPPCHNPSQLRRNPALLPQISAIAGGDRHVATSRFVAIYYDHALARGVL